MSDRSPHEKEGKRPGNLTATALWFSASKIEADLERMTSPDKVPAIGMTSP